MVTTHEPRQDPAAPHALNIVSLARASSHPTAELGGKGRQLAVLRAAGFAVPPGFCVTTSAFLSFLEQSGAKARLADVDTSTRAGFERAREIVRAAPIPAAMEEQLRQAYEELGGARVAVRSSAVDEDSAARSFAGQHDTLLNVRSFEDVLDALRACWASLWSDRAWTYREMERGPAASTMAIAVVVQEMVAAESAGVIFTTDPVVARPDHLILEACWGLGEGLVAGRVATDSYVIDTRAGRVAERQLRYKITEVAARSDGGVALVKIPHERRDAPVLSDARALELARVAMQIRSTYGTDQDIEWAYAGGKFYILQSRPITTRPARQEPIDPRGSGHGLLTEGVIWSRMDIGEIFTGILTPLGLSFARYYQYHVHSDCARSLGIHHVGNPTEYMGYVHGHVYLNVSYGAAMLAQCPPTRDQAQFTTRFSSEEVDLTGYVNPYGAVLPGAKPRQATAYWLKYVATELATFKARARRMTESRFQEYDRARALDLTAMSLDEIDHELQRDLEYFRRMHYGYMPYYINAFAFYGILEQVCRNDLGEEGVSLQNRLKADMSNLRTVEGAREVWQLAQAVKENPRVHAIIKETAPDETAAALRADPDGRRFWADHLEPFFRINGVRGRQEMELSRPRWIDDPAYVFQMARNYIVNDFAIDDVIERGREHRQIDTRAILGKLPRRQRAMIRTVIRMYSVLSDLRETVRMSMITSVWMIRRLVYELARRLTEQGLLRSIDEVIHLDFHDLLDYAAGRRDPRALFTREAIDASRQEHLHNLRVPDPPLTFIGLYDPSAQVVQDSSAEVIHGLGTSPGRVVGKARVIHDLVHQADEFSPNEIIVTSFTDASWTPLFAIAAGVVTDIGSMLSHSSIVSREFNIPSVVNTKVATQAIRTGDTLIVDGDRGSIHIQRA
ncbi:MAG: PEP/pyruvate-binding domain-containing protein [Kofleriaceae bacterium]